MSNTEAQGHDDKSLIKNLKDENIQLKDKGLYLKKLMEAYGVDITSSSKKKLSSHRTLHQRQSKEREKVLCNRRNIQKELLLASQVTE